MEEYFCTKDQSAALKELGLKEDCIAITNGDKLFYGRFSNLHNYYEHALFLKDQAIKFFLEKYERVTNKIINENGSIVLVFIFYTKNEEIFVQAEGNTLEESKSNAIDKLIEICKSEIQS